MVRQYNKNANELNGLETCTIVGKKNDKAVNEDLLKDEIVSEHLTRLFILLSAPIYVRMT